LAKEINPLSLRFAKSFEIRFSFWALPKTGNSFLFFGCKPKKKKHISLIRENPRPQCPHGKILFSATCPLRGGVSRKRQKTPP